MTEELNQTQQNIAEKVGELLAESSLEDDIKTTILDNLDKVPEYMLVQLLEALEDQKDELDRVAFEVEMFLKEQDQNWEEAEEEQTKAAETVINAWAEKLK